MLSNMVDDVTRYEVELAVIARSILSIPDVRPEADLKVRVWAKDGIQAGQLAVQIANSLSCCDGVSFQVQSVNKDPFGAA